MPIITAPGRNDLDIHTVTDGRDHFVTDALRRARATTGARLPEYVAQVAWLPAGFVHPAHVELATGHHLRPIRATDVDIDYPAVMGSRESLWAKYGEAWGWPPSTMTFEQDRDDLARHEREIAAHETFNYAVLDADETELLGCVYVDPPSDDSPGGTTRSPRGGSSTATPAGLLTRHSPSSYLAGADVWAPRRSSPIPTASTSPPTYLPPPGIAGSMSRSGCCRLVLPFRGRFRRGWR